MENITPLLNRRFEVVTATQGGYKYLARTLVDFENPNAPMYQLTIRQDGTVSNVFIVKVPFVDITENYSHGTLYETDAGGYSFKDLPYRPSSYPAKQVEVEVYYHNDGKVWAMATKEDLVFFANDQTEHQLVCQRIETSKITKAQRVADKIGKGYFLQGKKKYIPATNSFI